MCASVTLTFIVLFSNFLCYVFFFFFKQKTAYEMRISDWSSDVCSSDLLRTLADEIIGEDVRHPRTQGVSLIAVWKIGCRDAHGAERFDDIALQIGRASCRERVCQYV